METSPALNPNGSSQNSITKEFEHLYRIRGVIKEFFNKTPFIKKNSLTQVYCLQRSIENYLNENCAHGDIIEAMMLEGFIHEKSKPNSLTCYFNVDPVSIKNIRASSIKKQKSESNIPKFKTIRIK